MVLIKCSENEFNLLIPILLRKEDGDFFFGLKKGDPKEKATQ